MHTNHDIFMMLKKRKVIEVVCALINEYGEEIGSKNSLNKRIYNLKVGKSKKKNYSAEFIEWASTFFYDSHMEIEIDKKEPGHPKSKDKKEPGHPKSKLVNKPVRKNFQTNYETKNR